jgi:hypothetical protein
VRCMPCRKTAHVILRGSQNAVWCAMLGITALGNLTVDVDWEGGHVYASAMCGPAASDIVSRQSAIPRMKVLAVQGRRLK